MLASPAVVLEYHRVARAALERYPSDLTDEEWSLVEPLSRLPNVVAAGARWWCERW
jgi:hypothetical protein